MPTLHAFMSCHVINRSAAAGDDLIIYIKSLLHVDAILESAQEALAVVLDPEALQEGAAPVAGGHLLDVDDLDAALALLLLVERPPEDALTHSFVGGQLLQRRPAQVLLLVAVLLLRLRPPEGVLRLHLPERLRDGGAPAQAPTARRRQRRRSMLIRLRHSLLERLSRRPACPSAAAYQASTQPCACCAVHI